jgi:hypothetical protein
MLQVSNTPEANLMTDNGDLGSSSLGEVLGMVFKTKAHVGSQATADAWHLGYHDGKDNSQVSVHGCETLHHRISEKQRIGSSCHAYCLHHSSDALTHLAACAPCCVQYPGETPVAGYKLITVHPLFDGDVHQFARRLHARSALQNRRQGVRRVALVQLLELALDVSGGCTPVAHLPSSSSALACCP